MKIHLHVGVHKTATTLIQNFLAGQKSQLNAKGVGFIKLEQFRQEVTQRLYNLGDDFSLSNLYSKFFSNSHPSDACNIIISDENLVGYCGTVVRRGKPFVDARQRLSKLKEIFKDHEVKLFVAIRSYDTFITSAYCEGLRNIGTFVPFKKVKGRVNIEDFRWPRILEEFQESLSPSEMIVWRFEDFFDYAPQLIERLSFGVKLEHNSFRSQRMVRPSFSNVAVDVLGLVREMIGPEAANKLLVPVTTKFPKGSEFSAYNPWLDHEKQSLMEMYKQDCLNLPVSLWSPTGNSNEIVSNLAVAQSN